MRRPVKHTLVAAIAAAALLSLLLAATRPPFASLPSNETHGKEREKERSSHVEHVTFAVLILVSHKPIHYSALVESLTRSTLPVNTHVFVSHDGMHEDMTAITARLKNRFPVLSAVQHPFSCSDSSNTSFPRVDSDGHEIPYWRWACAKNHWIWAANRVFSYFPRLEWLLYLEEDFLVPKHVYELHNALTRRAASSAYFGTMLECRDNLWTVSGALKRAAWLALRENRHFFCNFNDYNWDLSLKQTFLQDTRLAQLQYVCADPSSVLAVHVGVFGKGLTHGEHMPDDEIRSHIEQAKKEFYAKTDHIRDMSVFRMESLHTPHAGLGGYSDTMRAHCLHVMAWFDRHHA